VYTSKTRKEKFSGRDGNCPQNAFQAVGPAALDTGLNILDTLHWSVKYSLDTCDWTSQYTLTLV